ncbi:response regulator transcription factor [Streptomyces bluensis]|uniref:response regulator transcription factor n=1 Tax=Streptomyces bluensis TaxID=33897 RepID=UPI00332235C2
MSDANGANGPIRQDGSAPGTDRTSPTGTTSPGSSHTNPTGLPTGPTGPSGLTSLIGTAGDSTESDASSGSGEASGSVHGRRVRVVLVDDHRMFRTGVQAEIGETERTGVEVVGEAADVDQAVSVISAARPEVVLLDVHLPGGGGVEVLRRCAAMMSDAEQPVRFLALSVSDAAEDVIGVIRGGARGYVTKTITGTDLVDSIFRVQEGDAVFSPRLAGFVLDAFASTDAPPVDEDLDRLTQREREVLRLIARGYAYKEIAKQLYISVKTVESHVSAVLRKLQLSNRHELTRWATARRLV